MSAGVGLEIRDVRPEELGQAAIVVARGMRDNPMHVAVFGEDVARREQQLAAVTGAALPTLARNGVLIGAYRTGTLVGVAGLRAPGRCRPSVFEVLRLLPRIARAVRLVSLTRMGTWRRARAKHDLGEPHWHLGPVAVDRDVQRQRIGSALLEEVCARMDREGVRMYLETDKSGTVAFYRMHDFAVVGEDLVLGVPHWFMKRDARSESAAASSVRSGHRSTHHGRPRRLPNALPMLTNGRKGRRSEEDPKMATIKTITVSLRADRAGSHPGRVLPDYSRLGRARIMRAG